MQKVLEQIDRLKQVYDKKTDTALADALCISKITISGWKKRGAIPAEVFKRVAQNESISMDWLLNGTGVMKVPCNYDEILKHLDGMMLLQNVINDKQSLRVLELLPHAPKAFIEQIILRLEEFERLSKI